MSASSAAPDQIIGRRHHGDCLCGCQFAEGERGELVKDDDTPKLAELGMAYYAFGKTVVCYSLDEAEACRVNWHRDVADAARSVLRPGWSGIVTLKSDGECRLVPERVYRKRATAFGQATRLLHDDEIASWGSLTPNYYVVQRTDNQLIVWAGPGYVMHVEHTDCGNCGGELAGTDGKYECTACGMMWHTTGSGSREPMGRKS